MMIMMSVEGKRRLLTEAPCRGRRATVARSAARDAASGTTASMRSRYHSLRVLQPEVPQEAPLCPASARPDELSGDSDIV
jgi:hypothetical protein